MIKFTIDDWIINCDGLALMSECTGDDGKKYILSVFNGDPNVYLQYILLEVSQENLDAFIANKLPYLQVFKQAPSIHLLDPANDLLLEIAEQTKVNFEELDPACVPDAQVTLLPTRYDV